MLRYNSNTHKIYKDLITQKYMEQRKRIFISLGILVALIIGFFAITSAITKYTGYATTDNMQNSSQTCLGKQDIKLYINSANTDDALRETGLLDYLQYFDIHNCFTNNQPCIENNIDNFPTWIINGKKYVGDISVEQLGQYTGCKAG